MSKQGSKWVGSVNAATRDGILVTEAYTDPTAPLVVFHPAGTPIGTYGIVHRDSGYCITGGRYWENVRKAKAAMKKILPLADWTQGTDALTGTKNLGKQIHEIATAFGAVKEK